MLRKYTDQNTALARCCAILLVITLSATPVQAAPFLPQADPNVLMKEDFEGAFANDPNCTDGTCAVPQGWRVWFIPHRETDPQGINYPPAYAQTTTPNLVKSGAAAQRIFTENKTFTAGIYRTVENVKPGSRLRFSVWGQVWSTNDNSPISARPSTDIRVKIGIDPMAEGDAQPSPFNGRVVWSGEQDAKDNFVQFTIEAEAKSSVVTVWTYTTMKDAVRRNEVFWDEAVLEVIAPPPGADSQPVSTTATITEAQVGINAAVTEPAPAPPPVQASPGVTYTVKEGDTLFAIALQYNKDVEEIKRLNKLDSDFLSIDQVLVIEPAVEGAPAPAPTAVPALVQPDQQPVTNTINATAAPNGGALCLQAYFDNNGNGARDSGENLVPNVLFTVTAGGTTIGTYQTDGVNEPHCLANLAVGAYTAAATLIPDYVATSPLNDTVNVSAGSNSQFSVGMRRASDGNTVIQTAVTPTPAASQGSGPSAVSILLTVAGVLLILGAVGFGALLFLQGRRL